MQKYASKTTFKVTYLGCILDETMSGELMAVKLNYFLK